jgi:uncharacterized membrane protein YeiH
MFSGLSMIEIFFVVLEAIGVISFAIAGAVAAIDKEIDLFGVLFLSIVTCFGGGILRDTLIGKLPSFFTGYFYIACCIATSLTVFIIAAVLKEKYINHKHIVDRINNYFDAVGLGIFSVMGAKICILSGQHSALVAIFLGMLTGVGGGMIRDLCLREIPFVFKKRVYAVASIAGAATYYILFSFTDLPEYVSMLMGIALVFVIRMLATIYKLNIPKAIIFDKVMKKTDI